MFEALSSAALTELLFNLPLEKLHFCSLAMHQQHVTRLCHANQLHDALCISMCTEGHVLHLELHIQLQRSQTDVDAGKTDKKINKLIYLGLHLMINLVINYSDKWAIKRIKKAILHIFNLTTYTYLLKY